MAKHVDKALKSKVLEAVKSGMKVSEARERFGVSDNAIYARLRAQADNTGTSALEVAKLRRENADLKEIIGTLALERRRAEKNEPNGIVSDLTLLYLTVLNLNRQGYADRFGGSDKEPDCSSTARAVRVVALET